MFPRISYTLHSLFSNVKQLDKERQICDIIQLLRSIQVNVQKVLLMKFLYLLESIISFRKLSGFWNSTEFFPLQCIFIISQVPTDLRLSILHARMLWSGLIWFQSVGFLASTSLVMASMSRSHSSRVSHCCSIIVSIFCYLRGFSVTAYGNRK